MLKRLFIYILIGMAVTFGPLYYINNYMLCDKTVSFNSAIKKNTVSLKNSQIKVPDDSEYVSVTSDKNYVTYIDENKLYIQNASNGSIQGVVEDDNPIIYQVPIADRNLVLYFTYDNSELKVKTYDLDNNQSSEHKTIEVRHLDKIKDVKYSSLTNVIYLNAGIKKLNFNYDEIYKIDIMSNVTLYAKSNSINKMQLLNGKDTLVYEDSKNRIYIKKKKFNYDGETKFRLLGVDGNDNIYLMKNNDSGDVLVVKDNVVTDEKKVEDCNFKEAYTENNRIYLVYDNYILDISNNDRYSISPNDKIISISKYSIITKDKSNSIVKKNI